MNTMFHGGSIVRRRVVQNRAAARQMGRFFRNLPSRSPEFVAKEYGNFLLDPALVKNENQLVTSELSGSRFVIGLATGDGGRAFDNLTKRAALVSDTLLLTHYLDRGEFHHLRTYQDLNRKLTASEQYAIDNDYHWAPHSRDAIDPLDTFIPGYLGLEDRILENNNRQRAIGMFCPDLGGLGEWLLAAEPILKAGIAWYLPSYAFRTESNIINGAQSTGPYDIPRRARAVDFLVTNRRAVDASGVKPIKSRLVRPVLSMDLPFIDGVSLRDFSEITVSEFASYSSFRDFLRRSFLDLDEGMNAVESERELVKVGLQIKDQVRAVRSQMEGARRKRAVAATGATIGSISAILVAVYGPALAAAVAAIGASGGAWGIINATADNDIRALKQDSWYYVWALAKASSNTYI